MKYITPAIAIMMLLITACEPQPQPIQMGEEECAHCNMMISEEPYAAQLVSSTGRHFSFDAIECMAAYTEDFDGEIHSIWVRDFNNSGDWFDATQAIFLRSDELQSPMSVNLSAYNQQSEAEENQNEYGGELYTWDEVVHLVREQWGHSH